VTAVKNDLLDIVEMLDATPQHGRLEDQPVSRQGETPS
jgi:hypothetical protein